MSNPLFTSGEVATKLELPRWRLLYLIEKGDLPGPSHTVPGRRLFTRADVNRVKEALDERKSRHSRTRVRSARRD